MKGLIINNKNELKMVNDIPEPTIGPYDSLVENIACGICNGTDVKLIEGHFKGFNNYPAVLGHEACGRIVKLGDKVTTYKVGDLVLRSMLYDSPKYYSGWGGFAEYGFVSDFKAMEDDNFPNPNFGAIAQQIVPANFDPNLAQMIITLKEVLSGLKRFGVSTGMKVMVNGCGPVGLSMVRMCKLLGVKQLIASDKDEKRLQKAGELGADVILNAGKEDIESKVKELVPEGLDIFIDAVGFNGLINLGLKLIKFNGKVAVYGISPVTNGNIDWETAPYNWNVHFVQFPTFVDEAMVHEEVVEYVRCGAIKLEDFVTHVLPFEDFEKGFELVRNKQAMKVCLRIKK